MALQWYTMLDFSGGENVDLDPDNLADNEVMKGENVDFNLSGGFKTRLGCVKLNADEYVDDSATPVTVEVEQVIEWKKIDGSVQLMAVIGHNMCAVDDLGVATVVQELHANAKKCFSFPFQENWYFGDGYNYYVYNGTVCSEVTPATEDPDAATPEAIAGIDLTFVKGCKYAVWHAKSYRWLFAGNSDDKFAIMYSEPNAPDNIQSTSRLYPTFGMGEIVALKAYGDAIIVFYRYGARVWRGLDPETDVEWQEIPIPEGGLSNDAINLVPGALMYLGTGGWWMLPPAILGYSVAMETADEMVPNVVRGKQTRTITSIAKPDIACSVYDPQTGFNMMAYTKTVGESRNSRVLIHRWGSRCFWHYTGWQVNDWCLRANGDILFASKGHIYKIRNGTNDAGVAINQLIETKKSSLSLPDNYKILGKMLINTAQRPEVSTLDMIIKSEAFSINKLGVNLNDTFSWSGSWSGRWGGAEFNSIEINIDPALNGRRFQIIISNSRLDEAITIYGISYGFTYKQPIGKRV